MKKRQTYEVKLPEINFLKIFLLLLIGIFVYFFVSNCFVNYFILKSKVKILENQLNKLKEENQRLSFEAYLLENDTDTIEYHIRKELNYKKPEEKIIILR